MEPQAHCSHIFLLASSEGTSVLGFWTSSCFSVAVLDHWILLNFLRVHCMFLMFLHFSSNVRKHIYL